MNTEIATLGGGCFWCLEAFYQRLKGVISVQPGYAGGSKPNPTYQEVCSTTTGHAEVVQIQFHSQTISYQKILDWFWKLHDPTTLNRQGNDVGPQYRSIILTQSNDQTRAAEHSKHLAQNRLRSPIVTEISPLIHFYPAEEYHRNYYLRNPDHPYCTYVISPKLRHMPLAEN